MAVGHRVAKQAMPFIHSIAFVMLVRTLETELPSVFRLPLGGFHATKFSSC